jgi:transposase
MDFQKLHLHWRTSTYKGNTYRSYSLARAYRVEGKNRKEIVLKLGKLSEEEVQQWRRILDAFKNPDAITTTLNDIVVTEHFDYLNVAAANAIWDEWKLDDVFTENGKREVHLATIARILAVNRCVHPRAKSQTPEWFRHTALPWLLDVNPSQVNSSRIFRELEEIENCKEAICEHLFQRMSLQNPESMKSVFYDLSSTTFFGSRCVLMKWGHCKEGYRNHVVLAIVVNRQGLPFYWEVLPGGTADATTIGWLLQRLADRFKIAQTTLIFDRGMVSDENLTLLENEQIKYISAMDKSQLETVTGISFKSYHDLTPDRVDEQARTLPGFHPLNNDSYYREIKVEGKRRFILCFNPQLFKDQRQARQLAVDHFSTFVKDLNAQLREAKKSRQRKSTVEKFKRQLMKAKLEDFIHVKLSLLHKTIQTTHGSERTVRTYQGTVEVDENKVRLAGKLDGFWLLVTNHNEKNGKKFNVSAPEIVTPYRDKVVIESAFRDIKSFIEVAPVYVWTEAHVKAHYSICVLSHLINRTLTLRLHEHKGKITQDVVSHEKLYTKLEDCKIDRIEIENVHQGTMNRTRPTNEQQELLKRIGLENLLSCDIVEKIKTVQSC